MTEIQTLPYSHEDLNVEVVERKGLGHPDTLADSIAESASSLYSQYFYKVFNCKFAHHWFDKVVLIGGESKIDYLVGEILAPYKMLFIGKGVKRVGAKEIPTRKIFLEAASKVCSNILIGFDSLKHIEVIDMVSDYQGPGQKKSRYRPASEEDLVDLDRRAFSNDCNVCISFWPLSPLERIVLETELHLNSMQFRRYFDEITGADIKIVGQRINDNYNLLINLPFLASRVSSWSDYLEKVSKIQDYIYSYVQMTFNVKLEDLSINPERTRNRPYLTVLGSVADTGDVGVVGRGNRANGLITPMRPMSIEAWAGKNPIDHTGKLYTFACERLAKKVYELVGLPCQVLLTSSKEKSISLPDIVAINLYGNKNVGESTRRIIDQSVRTELSTLKEISLNNIFEEQVFDNLVHA